jgi:hypothetical protein
MVTKYTPELTQEIATKYIAGTSIDDLVAFYDIPSKSIIAKLSMLGVYKKKEYRTKQGGVPIKKSEYIERLADLLGVDIDTLESLEKVNKTVLILLEERLSVEKEKNIWSKD